MLYMSVFIIGYILYKNFFIHNNSKYNITKGFNNKQSIYNNSMSVYINKNCIFRKMGKKLSIIS